MLDSDQALDPPVCRSTRQHRPPLWQQNYIANYSSQVVATVTDTPVKPLFNCFLATITSTNDPVSFKNDVQRPHWVAATNTELEALEHNEIWSVTELPQGKTTIGCKWLFKIKYNPDGSIERHKSRLVILGRRQRYGENYTETFTPVAKMTTVQTMLAVVAIED